MTEICKTVSFVVVAIAVAFMAFGTTNATISVYNGDGLSFKSFIEIPTEISKEELEMKAFQKEFIKEYEKVQPNTPPLLVGYCMVEGGGGTVIRYIPPKKGDGVGTIYVLTAHHVVFELNEDKSEKTVKIQMFGFTDKQLLYMSSVGKGKIVDSDKELDYAIIEVRLPHKVVPAKTISPEKALDHNLGEEVWSVGSPLHAAYWISKGVVSHKTRTDIGHNCGTWYGFSGGPIYNKDKVQIAMNVSIGGEESVAVVETVARGTTLHGIYLHLGKNKIKKYFGHGG